MDFDAMLAAGWADHADRPESVANRLAAAADEVDAGRLAAWLRLWVHVLGEHLGDWERGIAGMEALRPSVLKWQAGGAAAAILALDVGIATLRAERGDANACAALPVQGRATALATAAAALAGRADFHGAIERLDEALQAAAAAGPLDPAACRALAVAGNNLAEALEARPQRTAPETAGMLRAAEAGLLYWPACGGWLETERAAFRLACSALQAGVTQRALEAARQCLAVCEANRADAFERFFAHAVLARALHAAGVGGHEAQRAAAQACLMVVPEGERHWCEAERAALNALPD